MKIKGFDKFREKLPALSGKRIIFIPIYFALCMVIDFGLFIIFESLANNDNILSVLFPILAMTIIETIFLIMVYQMWFWRDRLKAKYGLTGYQRIFFVGLAGVIGLISLSFNNLIPITILYPSIWNNPPLSTFAIPLNEIFGWDWRIFEIIRWVLGGVIALIGFLTMIRSILTFGFDYMTVVYLYFPEESEHQTHEIYSILRHPAYSAIIFVSMAGFIIQFSILSLIFFILYCIGFYIHINFVEEPELISRFGEDYKSYKKSVPAIFMHPKNILKFLKFLFGIQKKDN